MDQKKKAKRKAVGKSLKRVKAQGKSIKPKRRKKAEVAKKAPSTGQSGAPLDLEVVGLNAKERRVLNFLDGTGSGVRKIYSISDIATGCWKSKTAAQANSWVRNSLRRLIRAGLIEKTGRGEYRVAMVARRGLSKAA